MSQHLLGTDSTTVLGCFGATIRKFLSATTSLNGSDANIDLANVRLRWPSVVCGSS